MLQRSNLLIRKHERPKMTTTKSREENFSRKEEPKAVDHGRICKGESSSSITPWSRRQKDPRIVPVSRASGRKDRHSKVYTVRGLRDRRVRLSVPTAIQLYDLQDRLGLNQPSKVVDWLLNVAKHDIDDLPPLQVPPGGFGENHGSSLSNFWNSDAALRDKAMAILKGKEDQKESWKQARNEVEETQGNVEGHGANVSHTTFLLKPIHHFIPGLLNNVVPYNSSYRLDSSRFSSSQTDDFPNFSFVPLPLPLPSTSSFLSHVELDPEQTNHFQILGSNSQNPLSNSPIPIVYSIGGQSIRPLSYQDNFGSRSNNG